jgi:hypothetical protein
MMNTLDDFWTIESKIIVSFKEDVLFIFLLEIFFFQGVPFGTIVPWQPSKTECSLRLFISTAINVIKVFSFHHCVSLRESKSHLCQQNIFEARSSAFLHNTDILAHSILDKETKGK